MKNDSHDLEVLLRSRVPIVVMQTREESRALSLLKQMRHQLQQPMYKWTVTEGIVSLEFEMNMGEEHVQPLEVLNHIKSASRPGIYVLIDFHPFLDEPSHIRLCKDIAQQFHKTRTQLVFLSHQLVIPEELKHHAAHFELSLPDDKHVKAIVTDIARDWAKDNTGQKVKTDGKILNKIIQNLSGLTSVEVKRLAHNIIYDDGAIMDNDLPELMKAKYELLNKDGILHFEYETEKFADVAGFGKLKTWLTQRQVAFDKTIPGLDKPKGMLLLGVQGCGKSLAAKAVAGMWNIPLLRFDFAAVYNKFHGETERNLREALASAEAMAPCVLWIDEIEKAISSSDSDGGTSQRVLGTLLTWMAEKKKPVFMVATANDISRLPPELVRKGRFDEIFFVDLPDLKTRKAILEIHLHKRDMSADQFDMDGLASKMEGFSGAEIEQSVVSAWYSAHAQQEPLRDSHILAEVNTTRPLSIVMSEKIDQLRNWASERTVPVD